MTALLPDLPVAATFRSPRIRHPSEPVRCTHDGLRGTESAALFHLMPDRAQKSDRIRRNALLDPQDVRQPLVMNPGCSRGFRGFIP